MPAIAIETTSKMTNIGSGECIPLIRQIPVCYTNGSTTAPPPPVILSLTCSCGAVISPSPQTVGPGTSGTIVFTVTHPAAGAGHTITATLTQGGVLLSSDEVAVSVGNPCTPVIDTIENIVGGVPYVSANAALKGTLNVALGNRIILLVEDPGKKVAGVPPRPLLIFADQAEVDLKEGKWKHAAIPNAKKDHQLRVVLTKDGVVKSIIRAVFK